VSKISQFKTNSTTVVLLTVSVVVAAALATYYLTEVRPAVAPPRDYTLLSETNVTTGISPAGAFRASFQTPPTGPQDLDAISIFVSTNLSGCNSPAFYSIKCSVSVFVTNLSDGVRAFIFSGPFLNSTPINILVSGGNYTYLLTVGNSTTTISGGFLASIVVTMMGQVSQPVLPALDVCQQHAYRISSAIPVP
jgi:hypothetical protein